MKTPSIRKNFIMESIMTLSTFIFPLITFPYVSRILLPEGIGKVSFATSLISYFNIIAQMGIPKYGIRACAQVRDDRDNLSRTVQELMLINLVMSLFAYICLAVALIAVPRLREERLLYIIVSATILFNTIGMEWLYKALECYTYIMVRSLVFKVVALVMMFALIHSKEDYVIYGVISIFASSASNIFNFFHAHKYIKMRPMGNYEFRRHLKPIAVFFTMACATTIYTQLDTIMLGFIKIDADVGIYNAAVKVKTILVSIVTSLGTVLLPRASYYVKHGQMDLFERVTSRAIHFVMLAALPLSLYFSLFARQGILFLSGSAYLDAVVPMRVIMPTILFIGISNILGIQILVPLGKEQIVLYSEVLGAVIDVVLNAIFIPLMASTGAAIGTLVAEGVVLLIQWIALRGKIEDAFRSVHYGSIMIALVLAVTASIWVPNVVNHTFLILIITACLFFCTYVGCLIWRGEPMVLELFEQMIGSASKMRRKHSGK